MSEEQFETISEFTNIVFASEARKLLLEGLNATADAVGCTLGPKGKTVLIQQLNGNPIVTKDGVTVSKSINLRNPLSQLGSKLIQAAASQTNEVAGDGTTTATILTQAMVNNCVKFLSTDHSSFSMKQGIQAGIKYVLANLALIKRDITTELEIKNVATISANGSEHIGELITSAINRVTKDGIITIEDAKGMNTTVEVVEGMQLNRGYLSPYFVNNKEKMITEYENCRVLVTNEKITDLNDIIELLNSIIQSRERLLIIADEVEGTAMQALVLNRVKTDLAVVAIKAPGYGDNRYNFLSDICALTGATQVGSTSGISLKTMKRDNLGTCKKIVVSKSSTTLIGDKSDSLNHHVDNIRGQLLDITLGHDQHSMLKARLASLVNGIAVIRVGGATELEMCELKDRVEDALNATKAATEEGIVPGGGMALMFSSTGVENIEPNVEECDVDAFKSGLRVVKLACEAPLRKIIENGGKSYEALKERLPLNNSSIGYDARSEKFVDMIQNGIIDPVKVTRLALENATSVALTFLSLDAVVYNERK